jgi:DNA replication protein DnaC
LWRQKSSEAPLARWSDIFSDQVVAAAMIYRIVHHAEGVTLKISSFIKLEATGHDPRSPG